MTQPALAQNVRGKGRHYAHPVTGDLVPSVTNIIGVLDKPALPRWAAKSVAENAWKMRHSLVDMGEAECIDVLKGSPWRKSTRAAERGTTIHDYLDAAANGVFLTELEGEAASYKPGADDFLCRYTPSFVRTEFTVFGDGYAGTADFMAVIGERLVIGDYKTGKSLYPEVALQLAAIRHADEIVTDTGMEQMPQVESCLAVLITPERCFVHEVAADATAFSAFLACRDAWTWQKNGSPIGVEVLAS
jgi:hypothetical protein